MQEWADSPASDHSHTRFTQNFDVEKYAAEGMALNESFDFSKWEQEFLLDTSLEDPLTKSINPAEDLMNKTLINVTSHSKSEVPSSPSSQAFSPICFAEINFDQLSPLPSAGSPHLHACHGCNRYVTPSHDCTYSPLSTPHHSLSPLPLPLDDMFPQSNPSPPSTPTILQSSQSRPCPNSTHTILPS